MTSQPPISISPRSQPSPPLPAYCSLDALPRFQLSELNMNLQAHSGVPVLRNMALKMLDQNHYPDVDT